LARAVSSDPVRRSAGVWPKNRSPADNVVMPKGRRLDLSAFDDKLLDGLNFCRKVYDLIDQVRAEPGGLAKLRLRAEKREKRLIEELHPIARYIQARYRVGNRIKIRWLDGSQQFDAILWSPLLMVKNAGVPRKILLEVTTSIHKNAHLARKLLQEQGGSFGPKSIRVNKKTRELISTPYVNVNDEGTNDLASQIIARLKNKGQKKYPSNTVLIVNCEADSLVLEDEWNDAIQRVKSANLHAPFREVFLVESTGLHWATLYGVRKRRAGR